METKNTSAAEEVDQAAAAGNTGASGEEQNDAQRLELDEENKGDGEEAEEDFVSNWTQSVESFDEMGLKEEILRGLYAFGFQEPSKIQQKGVLPVIQGRDTIA